MLNSDNVRFEILGIDSNAKIVEKVKEEKGKLDISMFYGVIIINLIIDDEVVNSDKLIITD